MYLFTLLILLVSCSHKVNVVSPAKHLSRSTYEAFASNSMVTSQGEATSRSALSTLERGGNIIDAFVTASFSISVERPQSTGLGGGGFLLYYDHKDQKVYAFDFREIAPLVSTSGMFLTKNGVPQPLLSQEGALAVATPGLVAGLYEIHKRFGKLSWEEVIQPAIDLARKGFPLYEHLHTALADRKHLLGVDPEARRFCSKAWNNYCSRKFSSNHGAYR
jgi:gamma-glutamyltranspeptidase/glutathione hydrolase